MKIYDERSICDTLFEKKGFDKVIQEMFEIAIKTRRNVFLMGERIVKATDSMEKGLYSHKIVYRTGLKQMLPKARLNHLIRNGFPMQSTYFDRLVRVAMLDQKDYVLWYGNVMPYYLWRGKNTDWYSYLCTANGTISRAPFEFEDEITAKLKFK